MLLCNFVKFSYRFLPIMFFPLLAQSGTRKMRLAFFLIAEFKMADKIQNGRQNHIKRHIFSSYCRIELCNMSKLGF